LIKVKKDFAKHSKFWLDDISIKSSGLDLIRLAAYRRAIANFVAILTGQIIPVKFSENKDSFTDGKHIQLGCEITKGQIDASVGLALHESSHIVKSDFDLVKNLWQHIPQEIYDAAKGKLERGSIEGFVKLMLNYVEDRYIDAWAYKNAPGYRGYYQALYERYWNSEDISKSLKSDLFRTPNLKNYKFRIINLTNSDSDLTALPKLQEISDLLDLKNILRLGVTPLARLEISNKICVIVLESIIKEDAKKKSEEKNSSQQSQNSSGSESQEEGVEDSSEQDDSNEPSKSEEKDSDSDDADIDDLLGGENGESEKIDEISKKAELDGSEIKESPTEDLSEDDIKDIEKSIQDQIDLTNGELNKKNISGDLAKRLQIMENSSTEIKTVGGEEGIPEVDCIVVKKMTQELMDDVSFPYSHKMSIGHDVNLGAVQDGIILGTMLGRKLQIRNDSQTTKFTRLKKGKLEKRLIAELGFGSENLFFETVTDQFKKAHLHISVDASESMSVKWKRTLTTVVAMAKAGSMVKNLDVVISFRSSVGLSIDETPYVLIAYDSRVDKFSKIIQLFPRLIQNGGTPEGLAFQAILDLIPPSSQILDSYFVNLSDGEPAFNGKNEIHYVGLKAWEHTKKQVEKIRSSGVEVMSYFLENQGVMDERITLNIMAFKLMYGRDAYVIDMNNVVQIAHTMNKKFLTKT
jgi:hypothetical protein